MEVCTIHFSRRFPDTNRIRNAVGHLAELTETPEKFKLNAIDGEIVYGAVKGDTLTVTHNQKRLSFSVSQENARFLVEVATQADGAFANVGLAEKLKLVRL